MKGMIFEKQIILAHTSILVVTVNQEIGEDRSSGSLASGRLLWKIQQVSILLNSFMLYCLVYM